MAYEVSRVEFRTELHARWSVFFDHLMVPWAYEPVTFHDKTGAPRTPAFWLPEQRFWFTAEVEAPAWWGQFTMAAEGATLWPERSWSEEAGLLPPVEVPEQWRGTTLLAEGPFFPEDVGALDPWGRPDLWNGPWRLYELNGMQTFDDSPYQWTMCPQCGTFGAEFCGYAERLHCRCLEDREHRKVANGCDKRLLAAYRAALAEQWHHHEDVTEYHRTIQQPTVREGLIRRAAADGDGMAVAGPLLTEAQVRQRLNWRVDQLSATTGMPGRRINALVNDSIGVKTRTGTTLARLGTALSHTEQWLADPASMPAGPRPPSAENLEALHGAELRKLLTTYVGPLSRAAGVPIPAVQKHLNEWMGAASRATAGDEQLRDAVLQAHSWVDDPDSYHAHARPPRPEPGELPAPMRTRPAPRDSTCNLCADPVTAGELTGRMPHPRQPYVPMNWLCSHCLTDRRAAPRLTDVLLRVFHHTFCGNTTTPLNTPEARVIHQALLAVPATTRKSNEYLRDAITALHEGIDAHAPLILLRYHPAHAAVAALHTRKPPAANGDTTILDAVYQHLTEWQTNPHHINQAIYADHTQWRQAVLENTTTPTPLSQRGGPFQV